ncbi:MAG TPA: hypothetical protein PLE54_06590 [Burkholderiaceae bacterium]|nr:hypothetical protein [Burkholderiaceae bacterium]HQR70252.1 hypothetical protein [Burkholderiaceae bacterium]
MLDPRALCASAARLLLGDALLPDRHVTQLLHLGRQLPQNRVGLGKLGVCIPQAGDRGDVKRLREFEALVGRVAIARRERA